MMTGDDRPPQDDFEKYLVVDYLDKNRRGVTIEQISNATGVAPSIVGGILRRMNIYGDAEALGNIWRISSGDDERGRGYLRRHR